MLRAVIFDMDGVLVCTDEYHFRSWEKLALERGVTFTRETFDWRMRGLARDDALSVFLEGASGPQTECDRDELARLKNAYFLDLICDAHLVPSERVCALIDELRSAMIKLAVASSSRNSLTILSRLGIMSYFDVVVDGNDAPGKPRPDVFILAADRLKVAPTECVVLEDSRDGVIAAQAAGMSVIGIGPPSRFDDAIVCRAAVSMITLSLLQAVKN